MQVDLKTPICGLSPHVLRRIVRNDPVDKSALAKATGLKGEAVARLIDELVGAGYLTKCDADGWWKAGDLGSRLAATPLIKRFPIAEGRALVEEMIAEARAIHLDKSHSMVVTKLVLFGSLLNGSDDGLIGDVDIAVETHSRYVGDRGQAARWREVNESCPQRLASSEFPDFDWPRLRIWRRLKKRRQKISIHSTLDAELTTNAEVYFWAHGLKQPRVTLPW